MKTEKLPTKAQANKAWKELAREFKNNPNMTIKCTCPTCRTDA